VITLIVNVGTATACCGEYFAILNTFQCYVCMDIMETVYYIKLNINMFTQNSGRNDFL
jgi:hypothetical protein